jgi:hypothetical protein
MKAAEEMTVVQGHPDTVGGCGENIGSPVHKRTDPINRDDMTRLHAQMIIETMTPFMGVLIDWRSEHSDTCD